ncbi:MAG: hypothetical protein OXC30_04490 [Alphaproteobacteria bacterium]|nr:hypothetical protein [Alphaproteobacteria bacterium]
MNNILHVRLFFLFCALALRCSVNLDIEKEREFLQPLKQNSDQKTLPDTTTLYFWGIFSATPDDEQRRKALVDQQDQNIFAYLEESRTLAQIAQRKKELECYENWRVQQRRKQVAQRQKELECYQSKLTKK